MMKATKTLKVRVKAKHYDQLSKMAGAVNFVWNYCNELSSRAISERGQFLSAYDFHHYTKGANKELGLHSQTVQCISKEYVTRRKQFKKSKLSWRKTIGVGRSLGWIPINTGMASFKAGRVFHNGNYYHVFDSFGLSQYKFRTSAFVEDARGHWYFCVVVEVEAKQSQGTKAVGVDLGNKTAAVMSDGSELKGGWYRAQQEKIGLAQRANNKKRVKALHAKVKNRRRDDMQKKTTAMVADHAAIFVGNVSSKAMSKTKCAKGALDNAWGMFKTMLEYKCQQAGVVFDVIDESYTTQACSSCGCISRNSPKGRAGLGIREWTCTECGTTHDRDINAALNILARGQARLAGEINPKAELSV